MRRIIARMTEDEADHCIAELSLLLSPLEQEQIPALQKQIEHYMLLHMHALYLCIGHPNGELNAKRYLTWILGAYIDARCYMTCDKDATEIMHLLAHSELVPPTRLIGENALETIVRVLDFMIKRATKNRENFRPDPDDVQYYEQLCYIKPDSVRSAMADSDAIHGEKTKPGDRLPTGLLNYHVGMTGHNTNWRAADNSNTGYPQE